MLASTVQFSNNDQPPITPNHTVRVHWGRQLRGSFPQTPNSVPDTLAASLSVPRSEEQYWQEKTIKCAE